jgi:hypothetical protein
MAPCNSDETPCDPVQPLIGITHTATRLPSKTLHASSGDRIPTWKRSAQRAQVCQALRVRTERPFLAKFAVFNFSALGLSFFDGAAPAQTRAYRPASQCQRIRLRHLLCPATTRSTPMQGTRHLDSLLLPLLRLSYLMLLTFYEICRKNEEPTSGLEPLTYPLYECAVMGCWGLQRLAKPAYIKGYLFSVLPSIAGYCVRVRVRAPAFAPASRKTIESLTKDAPLPEHHSYARSSE